MLTIIGWIMGFTASAIILSTTIFGLLSLYHAKKSKAKLLGVAGLAVFFMGLIYIGPFIDFLLVVTTTNNLTPNNLYVLISYSFVAPGLIFAMYLGAELLTPKAKKLIIIFYAILGVIFEVLLWTDTNQIFAFSVANGLIDTSINVLHPVFFVVVIILGSVFVFLGCGFLIKVLQSTGQVKKKFIYLSIGFFVFAVCGALESLIEPSVYTGIVRLIMTSFPIWVYLGLKP